MKLRFSWKYFLVTVIVFITELSIATVFKDIFFVRAFLGDVLVVILIYTFILSFFEVKTRTILIIGIFLFSVTVEVLQYFKVADLLGFRPGSWQHIVIGNSFSWIDMLCYAVGCAILWMITKKEFSRRYKKL